MSSPNPLTLSTTLPLPNTHEKIPMLGLGVYQSHSSACVKACLSALENGYRHIDSAQFYRNEAEVGSAVRESGLDRKDMFITTKILTAAGSVEKSYRKCIESVEKIDPGAKGYVDLFLIHSPNAGREAREQLWKALERVHEEGRAKCIGVSNYGVGHIEEMRDYKTLVWPPHVNQIELHPWCQQREIVEYCYKNKIVVEAYSPLVRNYKANNEVLLGVAKKYEKTTAQLLIRYCLQKGWVPLPKSENPERIKANADVYGFEIREEDMAALDDLDQGDAGAIVQAVTNSL